MGCVVRPVEGYVEHNEEEEEHAEGKDHRTADLKVGWVIARKQLYAVSMYTDSSFGEKCKGYIGELLTYYILYTIDFRRKHLHQPFSTRTA